MAQFNKHKYKNDTYQIFLAFGIFLTKKKLIVKISVIDLFALSESWKLPPSQVIQYKGEKATRHVQISCLRHILSTKMPSSGPFLKVA